MDKYKDTIFKLVGRFSIQGGGVKQEIARDLLREYGLQPFDKKKHQADQIGILVISEKEYFKTPNHIVQSIRDSGGRLVRNSWLEDLYNMKKWFEPRGNYLWEETDCVNDEDAGDDYEEYWDEECEDDEYEDVNEDDEFEAEGCEDDEYEDDEEYENEAYWDEEYQDDEYEAGDEKGDNNVPQLRGRALVYLTTPLT
ncbi:hypothetical protein NW765_017667 [Fusarium oxysporum]|nr:hypothetical protein NW765_017667 [Fusarium oxysporum]KAJ4259010.1 hypothetical protein NW764_016276 [Fusarium oxysporum]